MARLSGRKDPGLGGRRSRTEHNLTGKSLNLSETCFLHLGSGETQTHSLSGQHVVDLCWPMSENPSLTDRVPGGESSNY